jgi:hypothetical protein
MPCCARVIRHCNRTIRRLRATVVPANPIPASRYCKLAARSRIIDNARGVYGSLRPAALVRPGPESRSDLKRWREKRIKNQGRWTQKGIEPPGTPGETKCNFETRREEGKQFRMQNPDRTAKHGKRIGKGETRIRQSAIHINVDSWFPPRPVAPFCLTRDSRRRSRNRRTRSESGRSG